MLVLTRKLDQAVVMTTASGEEIRVQVLKVTRGAIKLGVQADESVNVVREELRSPVRHPGKTG